MNAGISPAARVAPALRRAFGGTWSISHGELIGDLGTIRVVLTPPKPAEPANIEGVPAGYTPMPPMSDLHWKATASTLARERRAEDVTAPAAVRAVLIQLRETMATAAAAARRDVARMQLDQRRHAEAADRLAAILGGGG